MMKTYFLQEYLTGTPSCFTATLSGDPALKSFFFPLYVRIVMLRRVRTFDGEELYTDGTIPKPFTVLIIHANNPTINNNSRIFHLCAWRIYRTISTERRDF